MVVAVRLRQHLDSQGASYAAVAHVPTNTSAGSARAAHVTGDRVVKPVVVHHADDYMPSSRAHTVLSSTAYATSWARAPVRLSTQSRVRMCAKTAGTDNMGHDRTPGIGVEEVAQGGGAQRCG